VDSTRAAESGLVRLLEEQAALRRPAAPIGLRVSMDQDSTAARVHRTGRPARVDVDDLPRERSAELRELGVRASVGAPVVVHGELWGAVVAATMDASFPPGAEQRLAARGLHPAVLTDHGLEAALGVLAARAPLPVELSVELDDRPPQPIEAAVYFVVAEALTNVARYASANAASVAVRREADDVVVEVNDDGGGGADPDAGTGLRGLIDRVEALGGRLEVQSRVDRGTTVRARLPES
jgi:hypothetical protein